jgi:hypothetical protein
MDWLFIFLLLLVVGIGLVMWDAKRWEAVHRPGAGGAAGPGRAI